MMMNVTNEITNKTKKRTEVYDIVMAWRLQGHKPTDAELFRLWRQNAKQISCFAHLIPPNHAIRAMALKASGYNARFFKDLTVEEMMTAIQNGKYAIESIYKRNSYVPMEVLIASVQLSYESVNVIPKAIVHANLKEFVEANVNVVRFLELSEEEQLEVCEIDPHAVGLIAHPCERAILAAIKADKRTINTLAFEDISESLWEQIIALPGFRLELCQNISDIPESIQIQYAKKDRRRRSTLNKLMPL